MHPQTCIILCCALLLLSDHRAAALTGTPPVLTNATWSANQFQVTLRGETNVSYIIEFSSDLRAWTPTTTNYDAQTTRTIVLPAEMSRGFWRVRPVPGPLFEHAIVARDHVQLGGSGRIDSFNSTNHLESTGGKYDPAKATDRASVASPFRGFNAISVGNMSIYGSVLTGPGSTVILGPNGNVGSIVFNDNPLNNGRIEPGHYRDDFQVVLPSARLPASFGPAFTPSAGAVGGTNYNYVFGTADYIMSLLSLSSSEKAIVTGMARVHVRGDVSISGRAYLSIPAGASLELYVSGTNATISGTGVANSGNATNFMYFALPTNTNLTLSASAAFVGTIYAPNAAVTFSGTNDAIGAVVSRSFEMSGGMDLHFDENLKHVGPFY